MRDLRSIHKCQTQRLVFQTLGSIVRFVGQSIAGIEQRMSSGVYVLIYWHYHYQKSDAKASKPTARPEVVQIRCASLQSTTNKVDDTPNNYGC
jgi:hypothetical protein